jgi:hypothetical protein
MGAVHVLPGADPGFFAGRGTPDADPLIYFGGLAMY